MLSQEELLDYVRKAKSGDENEKSEKRQSERPLKGLLTLPVAALEGRR